MDIGDVENFWDFGVFAKNNDISVGREHFYLDSQIAWYRVIIQLTIIVIKICIRVS